MIVSAATEYNPFHNGHKYHIEGAKRAGGEFFVAVMSGNFVQRGEPAIFDKHLRTRAALLNGADMVLELPYIYACAGAEFFARGAINIIQRSGISDAICFGAETENIDGLKNLARFINDDEKYKSDLKKYLKDGLSYPAARKAAVSESKTQGIDADLLDTPNNILGVEYLKAMYSFGYETDIIAVKRNSDHHGEIIDSGFTSAKALRAAINKNEIEKIKTAAPDSAYGLYESAIKNGDGPYLLNNLSPILQYIIKTRGAEYLENIFEAAEGLHNRIYASAGRRFLISDIIADVKTKRYAYTKISRVLLHAVLNITKDDYFYFESHGGPQYIRVLGYKKSSEVLLKRLAKYSDLPLMINLKNDMKKLSPPGIKMLENEIHAGDIFQLANTGAGGSFEAGYEYREPVVVV